MLYRLFINIESILIVRDLGVQVKTVYMDGRCISRFIDHSCIADIIINEGITMLQVKFYMAIIVEGQDRMVIVFEVVISANTVMRMLLPASTNTYFY